MEVGENHASKRSRLGNGPAPTSVAGVPGSKIARRDDDENDAKRKRGGGGESRGAVSWHHPSSRIYRVSRASGGKDRHSKVYTAKGLRDRRVRLSVSTAIQFYDLQDRLGYDQPSKAIEWLIKAAAAAINELPSLDSSFPEPPKQERAAAADVDAEEKDGFPQQQQQQHLTKSGCSSTSETSKGSVLSLSRSENRVKARERARERVVKDKDKSDRDEGAHVAASSHHHHHHSMNNPGLGSQTSFTELLTGGAAALTAAAQASSGAPNCIQKQIRQAPPPVTATADYFGHVGGLFGPGVPKSHQLSSAFSTQPLHHLGNSSHLGIVPFNIAAAAAAAAAAAGEHPEMQQQFSFLQDHHLIPVPDNNLHFSISTSGLAGLNRGTLQSNSQTSQLPHHHHHHHHNHQHLQRLSSPVDGSNLPFFFGGGAAAAAAPAPAATENPFAAGFDGRLQLWDGYKHADLKGKGKS